jgi:hypothetical protein
MMVNNEAIMYQGASTPIDTMTNEGTTAEQYHSNIHNNYHEEDEETEELNDMEWSLIDKEFNDIMEEEYKEIINLLAEKLNTNDNSSNDSLTSDITNLVENIETLHMEI